QFARGCLVGHLVVPLEAVAQVPHCSVPEDTARFRGDTPEILLSELAIGDVGKHSETSRELALLVEHRSAADQGPEMRSVAPYEPDVVLLPHAAPAPRHERGPPQAVLLKEELGHLTPHHLLGRVAEHFPDPVIGVY